MQDDNQPNGIISNLNRRVMSSLRTRLVQLLHSASNGSRQLATGSVRLIATGLHRLSAGASRQIRLQANEGGFLREYLSALRNRPIEVGGVSLLLVAGTFYVAVRPAIWLGLRLGQFAVGLGGASIALNWAENGAYRQCTLEERQYLNQLLYNNNQHRLAYVDDGAHQDGPIIEEVDSDYEEGDNNAQVSAILDQSGRLLCYSQQAPVAFRNFEFGSDSGSDSDYSPSPDSDSESDNDDMSEGIGARRRQAFSSNKRCVIS